MPKTDGCPSCWYIQTDMPTLCYNDISKIENTFVIQIKGLKGGKSMLLVLSKEVPKRKFFQPVVDYWIPLVTSCVYVSGGNNYPWKIPSGPVGPEIPLVRFFCLRTLDK